MFSQRIRATYLCVALSAGVGGVSSCLDRPVVPSDPVTSNQFVDLTTQRNVDKIDLLFMIDNSGSMSDKQEILKLAVPQLLGRLVSPLCHDAQGRSVTSEGGVCPEGFTLEYDPVDDIHIGVISSSLGTPNTTACAPELVEHADDAAHLIGLRRTAADGSPLNTYQGLGFLACAGVVINDNLVLLERINKLKDRGEATLQAVLHAGVDRFRPIVLTSLTTFVGLLPILFERSMQAQFLIPMVVSLAFGVLFSSVVTLFLVPCSYYGGERMKEKLQAWYTRKTEPAPEAVPIEPR